MRILLLYCSSFTSAFLQTKVKTLCYLYTNIIFGYLNTVFEILWSGVREVSRYIEIV